MLLEWFMQVQALNIPMQGLVSKQKAEKIAVKLNTEFTSLNGWFEPFRGCAGLATGLLSGESERVNEEDVEAWKTEVLPSLLTEYHPKDI
jgi:hypothetical protein